MVFRGFILKGNALSGKAQDEVERSPELDYGYTINPERVVHINTITIIPALPFGLSALS